MLTRLAAVGRSKISGLNAPRSPLGRRATWRYPRRWATAVGAVPKQVATMVAKTAAMVNPRPAGVDSGSTAERRAPVGGGCPEDAPGGGKAPTTADDPQGDVARGTAPPTITVRIGRGVILPTLSHSSPVGSGRDGGRAGGGVV